MKPIYLFILFLFIGAASALPTDEGPIDITVKEKWTKVISDGKTAQGLYLFSDMDDNVYSNGPLSEANGHLKSWSTIRRILGRYSNAR